MQFALRKAHALFKRLKQDRLISFEIHVFGQVQGVGFRPFIYKLAKKHEMVGWVKNTNECVTILTQGHHRNFDEFFKAMLAEAPSACFIDSFDIQESDAEWCSDFSILQSTEESDRVTAVSPDIAVCDECLADLRSQDRRKNYPFINCTNCGPRFTIIRSLPYDRERTTMKKFSLCDSCSAEYHDVNDRRFHAQPVACLHCGPQYLLEAYGSTFVNMEEILTICSQMLNAGKILAIKGMGGYHLACNALDTEAVEKLRLSKIRESKPFAVMFRDPASVELFCYTNEAEKALLSSWRRPIVILRSKKTLAPDVSNDLSTVGAMLPYMPFHYLLFERLKTPVIVLTSGNLTDEPIVISDTRAKKILSPISDALLSYNRDIFNRTDDSVTMVVSNKERIIRRSRGYAPTPIRLDLEVDGIMAAGAELSNCFCIGKGNRAIMSQHIGDLKNAETMEFYEETYERFCGLFRFRPERVACDMHPDYLSTQFASRLGAGMVQVQHHHAHIASVMAENRISRKVIGVSFDGTGYGDDGNIWGGEFMVCSLEGYERMYHIRYVPMPGGDKAALEPWRMGLAYLYDTFGEEFFRFNLPIFRGFEPDTVRLVVDAINRQVNSPLTSSAGRLFDAVAAITGLCTVSGFHAEAPMRLENAITQGITDSYPFDLNEDLDFRPVIRGIVDDIRKDTKLGVISAKFHNTLVEAICKTVRKISRQTGIREIAFSGGCFQNRYLLERIEKQFEKGKYSNYTNILVPCNDGGLALGQLVVAAARS